MSANEKMCQWESIRSRELMNWENWTVELPLFPFFFQTRITHSQTPFEDGDSDPWITALLSPSNPLPQSLSLSLLHSSFIELLRGESWKEKIFLHLSSHSILHCSKNKTFVYIYIGSNKRAEDEREREYTTVSFCWWLKEKVQFTSQNSSEQPKGCKEGRQSCLRKHTVTRPLFGPLFRLLLFPSPE